MLSSGLKCVVGIMMMMLKMQLSKGARPEEQPVLLMEIVVLI
jgi:hypothetical protein